MRRHLVRLGCSTAIAERTLEKLRSLNYVNDESFARNYAWSRLESGGYGPKRIEQDLRTRGIGERLIRAILRDNFRAANEAQKARVLLEKRFKNKKLMDPKIARRAANFLQRRGYSDDVILDLLKNLVHED